jgi:hypothetical protein
MKSDRPCGKREHQDEAGKSPVSGEPVKELAPGQQLFGVMLIHSFIMYPILAPRWVWQGISVSDDDKCTLSTPWG